MYLFEFQLCTAVVVDLFCGDPRWFPHPVRIIGFFCTKLETFYRHIISSVSLAGLLTVLSVLFISLLLSAILLLSANLLSSSLSQVFAVFLLYTTIAVRDLLTHSKDVYVKLSSSGNYQLEEAREAVAKIVGRDTSELDRKGIVRATVETVAENMVDGITAPLFYGVLGSLFAPITGIAPIYLAVFGAIGYKAVNTMDSMIAYKNEKYLVFGKWAAFLDDIVNFIPARLSGFLLVIASALCGHDWRASFTVFVRDRLAHASPNAAHPEAAIAGALGIELGGASSYFGKVLIKPMIGNKTRENQAEDILQCNKLILIGSLLFLICLLLFRFLFLYFI